MNFINPLGISTVIGSIIISQNSIDNNFNQLNGTNLPVVMWHGMGDYYNNPDSMNKLIESANKFNPSTFIYSIRLDDNSGNDRSKGFFGNVNQQVDTVCKQLRDIKELKNGFNAIGFSQGGLFLRAYNQRCNIPPIRTLVTLGSPHSGVSDVPGCSDQYDTVKCLWMRSILRNGAYAYYIRDHVIQAQYIKDPTNLEVYLKYNQFLPDINNEHPIKNSNYKFNLMSLDKLVLIKFSNDTVLQPKETSWFGFYDEKDTKKLNELKNTKLYTEDWIGTKQLDLNGKLIFKECHTEHMQFGLDYFESDVLPHVMVKDPKFTKKNGRQTTFF